MGISSKIAAKTTSTKVLTILSRHVDPKVRLAVVKNSSVSVKVLVDRTWNDRNKLIQREARRRLESIAKPI